MNKLYSVAIAVVPLIVSLLLGLYTESSQKCFNNQRVLKYWTFVQNMWNKNDNARTMKRVFDRLGHERVNGSINPQWDIFWSIEYPFWIFPNEMKNLKPHQLVNHFPGINFITYKAFMTTRNNLEFIPAAFEFPRMLNDFKKFVEKHPSKKFVTKRGDNRGVKLVSIDQMNFEKADGRFVQEFIDNPLLIDGHLFDLGVYVLITSINPLRIYRFKSEVLLRFCPEPYHPFDPNNIEKYVIYETWRTVFEMPSLKDMATKMGFSFKTSFETHLRSRGIDVDAIWKQIDNAIITLVGRNEKNLVNMTQEYGPTSHFFELVRFDFMIDDKYNVKLIEVNMSPNLTPTKDKFNGYGVGFEQVVFNALQCATGINSYSDFEIRHNNQRDDKQVFNFNSSVTNFNDCINNNCDQGCQNDACKFCAMCIGENELKVLHQTYLERIRCGEMLRIFPTPSRGNDIIYEQLSPSNKFLGNWLLKKCQNDENWC